MLEYIFARGDDSSVPGVLQRPTRRACVLQPTLLNIIIITTPIHVGILTRHVTRREWTGMCSGPRDDGTVPYRCLVLETTELFPLDDWS